MKYTCNICSKIVNEKKAIEWKHGWSTLYFCSKKCHDIQVKHEKKEIKINNIFHNIFVGLSIVFLIWFLFWLIMIFIGFLFRL